ncbi:O-acetyl-ADP-ribose deacetylase [Candidatus Bathyarchaeota archaeon]|nr:O-acetyl-ADP-ribose deacetylase [Candidatus Bathyarchaeota archaeon]
MKFKIGETTLSIIQGDLTEQDVEAIVNAANPSLMGGGGVDGAIHKKGGSKILEECKKIRTTLYPNGLPTGKAVITSGGNLKAKYVIHTVGPIWKGGSEGEPELLTEAYKNSLKLAVKKGLKTIAFPSISTGAYGYPIEKASRVALKAIKEFIEKELASIKEVRIVLFKEEDLKVYKEAVKELF